MRPADLDALASLRGLCATGAVRCIRESAGITRAELAASVGVSAGALTKWELGLRRPQGAAALRYARALQRLASRTTP